MKQRHPWIFRMLVGTALAATGFGCADQGGSFGDNQTSDTTIADGSAMGDTTVVGSDMTTMGSDTVLGMDTTMTMDTVAPPKPDADQDTISDEDEGAASNLDTDNDGTPDYRDADSDGDGISDRDEAGDADTNTRPPDTDGDGLYDFQDQDSDGNGVPDRDELTADPDQDGEPNFRDTDNDGDGIPDVDEIVGAGADCNNDGIADPPGSPSMPFDCNADGVPDYMSIDSDGDFIGDRFEGFNSDTDKDMWLDRFDADSDGDGISDAAEAGDQDYSTPPKDSDGDGRYDFQDIDSDNDGLSDADESALGTDPTRADTDGDGVSDLIENAAGTNPANAADNPQANGDFFFLVPYEEATSPTVDTLEFSTDIKFADIYFGFDTTGSMEDELNAMRNATTGVPAIIEQLRCKSLNQGCLKSEDCGNGICFDNQCIEDPANGAGCIPNMWTGVGSWDELDTFINRQSIQSDPLRTANSVPVTGGGGSEAPQQMPSCVADRNKCREGCRGGSADCSPTGIGCPGFRNNAVRIYIQITDADDQCGSVCSECSRFSTSIAGADLASQNIKFIGLYGTDDAFGNGTPQSIASEIGVASGTVDQSNNPFVYAAENASVVNQTVNAVRAIVRDVGLNVTITATDLPDDDGDAIQFIDYLEVNTSGTGNCTVVANTADTLGPLRNPSQLDGKPDSFPDLLPGTTVCWDVHPVLTNTTQMATSEPQVFKARLTVEGDGSPLDSREVFFLVPPVLDDEFN